MIIEINAQNFKSGCSNKEYSDDGGFSPRLGGNNLGYQDGLLAPPAAKGDALSTVDSGYVPIAKTQFNGLSKYGVLVAVNATDDLKVYEVATSGALTDKDTDTGRNYKINETDAVLWKGNYYITSQTDIARGGLGSLDFDWWTSAPESRSPLSAGYPHQLIIFLDKLFISNGTIIESYDGTTSGTNLMEFEDAISAMAIHENDVYIGLADINFYENSLKSFKNTLVVWDGVRINTEKARYVMPDVAYHIQSFKGILYVFFENYLAYFDGRSFVKIRNTSGAIYKRNVNIVGEIMYYTDGGDIIAFDGTKFWVYYDGSSTINISFIYNGDDFYIEEQDTRGLFKFDLNDIDGTGKFSSLWYDFPQNTQLKRLVIELGEVMVASDVNTPKIITRDSKGETTTTLPAMSYANDSGAYIKEYKDLTVVGASIMIQLDTFMNLIKRIIFETNESFKQPI